MHWKVKYYPTGVVGPVPMHEVIVCTPRKADAITFVDANPTLPHFVTRSSRDTTPPRPCLCGKRTS